jgi:polar amino acid transport system substrate-binding protein
VLPALRPITSVAALLALFSASSTAHAQQVFGLPWVAPELLDESRTLAEDSLTFCVNPDSPMADFDRAVAQSIAEVQLLDMTIHDVVNPTAPYKYDYRIPLTETELFVTITNNCDAFLGYRLVASSVPDWGTVSRPYFESKVVFVSKNPAYRSFGDLPAGHKIGVRLASTGHRELRTYLQSLPKDQQPTQVPYPNNDFLLQRFADGTLDTIMVWEFAPLYATGGEPVSLGIATTFEAPFPIPSLQFGAVMLKKDTFVRGLIDDAIDELTTSGELKALAEQYLPVSSNPA